MKLRVSSEALGIPQRNVKAFMCFGRSSSSNGAVRPAINFTTGVPGMFPATGGSGPCRTRPRCRRTCNPIASQESNPSERQWASRGPTLGVWYKFGGPVGHDGYNKAVFSSRPRDREQAHQPPVGRARLWLVAYRMPLSFAIN